jgi:hypothetical protein
VAGLSDRFDALQTGLKSNQTTKRWINSENVAELRKG